MAIYKGNDTSRVIYDFKRWVDRIQNRAEEKVEEAVSLITNKTNSDYSNIPATGNQISGNPIYYRLYKGKNRITGIATARESKELIYLEFGTRYTASDPLTIATGFKSGIDTISIAAPYRSNKPNFVNNKASGGNYYFLGNIDVEGIRFIRDFWK